MRRKCVQDARKSNFTAKCLDTFVAHCSFQLGEDMADVAFYEADVNDTGTNICCQICYILLQLSVLVCSEEAAELCTVRFTFASASLKA